MTSLKQTTGHKGYIDGAGPPEWGETGPEEATTPDGVEMVAEAVSQRL